MVSLVRRQLITSETRQSRIASNVTNWNGLLSMLSSGGWRILFRLNPVDPAPGIVVSTKTRQFTQRGDTFERQEHISVHWHSFKSATTTASPRGLTVETTTDWKLIEPTAVAQPIRRGSMLRRL